RGIPAAADVLIAKQDPASQRVAKWLHLKEGEPAYFIKRLFRANGEPVAVQESWWPSDVGLALVQANLAGEQLLRVLADELGIYIGEAEATIEAGAATAEEASLLLVRTGSPVLVLKRVDYCTDGRPVVSERLVFRADKYKYQARQVRNPQRRVGDWA
ncbi:MAG: UTRA domain-containing protein, partial [Dehalococcoidales bacterium]|nr:UTRA domain-containing protein [Dehalococcoidales bacterium]